MAAIRKALITGASRGIGAALATELLARDIDVVGCGRTGEPAWLRDGGEYVQVDLTDPAALQAKLVPNLHDCDSLVLNHSVLGPMAPIEETTPEQFGDVFGVNVQSAYAVLHHWLCQTESITLPRTAMLLSSSVGRVGRAGWTAYGASKWVVEAIAATLADQWTGTSNVSVSVNPGGTATDMRAEAYPQEDPSTIPSAHQVAVVMADWLTTGRSSLTNGAQLSVRDMLEA